jgi:hypothetical protein
MPTNPMNPQPPFAEPGKGLPEREIETRDTPIPRVMQTPSRCNPIATKTCSET